MEITVKKSTVVRPAQDTPKGSLYFSNLDIVMTRYHLPTVYFYKKPNDGCSNFFDPQKLKEALRKILVPFYPVAGRLGFDENGRLEINCNAEGVLFVEAETSSSIDQIIGDFTHDSQIIRLVPKVDCSGEISSYPLLVLQVTTFKCGGVCLGVGFQHTVVDGQSAGHFIGSWADTARGLSLNIAPFLDRTLLRPRVPPTPTFHHVEYDPPPTMNTTSDSISTSNDLNYKPSMVAIFKLTVDQLNTLKAKLKAENGDTKKYSTYNVLAAHLWRCISKARGLTIDQATKLHIPIDGRPRLKPPLPLAYFGNAIFIISEIARAGDLLSEPFINTAKRIHKLVEQVDDEYLRSAIDYIENVPDMSTLVRGSRTYRCPNLSMISWMWLPIYDADFGWGRPIYMRPASVVHEGQVFILPSATEDGSLWVITRLENFHMELFEQLLYEF